MLHSGPRSYYDDYIRKSGSQRVGDEAKGLLTDRGAYVNYLEVQLERVSSACLGVQAYEDRFNDMQNLIASLEQRCSTSTKLLSIVQQCCEEIRDEFTNKLILATAEFKDGRRDTLPLIQNIALRTASLEESLANLPTMQSRITATESKCLSTDSLLDSMAKKIDDANRGIQNRVDEMLQGNNLILSKIESNKTSISKLSFELDELRARSNNQVCSLETKIKELMQNDRDEVLRKLHSMGTKMNSETGRMQDLLTIKDADTLRVIETKIRDQSEQFDSIIHSLRDDFSRKVEAMSQDHTYQRNLETLSAIDTKSQLEVLDKNVRSLGEEQTLLSVLVKKLGDKEKCIQLYNTKRKCEFISYFF